MGGTSSRKPMGAFYTLPGYGESKNRQNKSVRPLELERSRGSNRLRTQELRFLFCEFLRQGCRGREKNRRIHLPISGASGLVPDPVLTFAPLALVAHLISRAAHQALGLARHRLPRCLRSRCPMHATCMRHASERQCLSVGQDGTGEFNIRL